MPMPAPGPVVLAARWAPAGGEVRSSILSRPQKIRQPCPQSQPSRCKPPGVSSTSHLPSRVGSGHRTAHASVTPSAVSTGVSARCTLTRYCSCHQPYRPSPISASAPERSRREPGTVIRVVRVLVRPPQAPGQPWTGTQKEYHQNRWSPVCSKQYVLLLRTCARAESSRTAHSAKDHVISKVCVHTRVTA